MKEYGKLFVVLTLVAFLCGAVLAFTYEWTQEPIRQAAEARLLNSLRRVVPASEESPQPLDLPAANGPTVRFFHFPSSGAVAFTVRTDQGYGGAIDLLVGLDRQGRITGLDVLTHNETPGLGSQILKPAFIQQFPGQPLHETDWRLLQEGGAVQGISGATISSRAFCDALRKALALYQTYRAQHDLLSTTSTDTHAP